MSIKSAILVILQIVTMMYLLLINKPISFGLGLLIQIFGILIGSWAIFTVKIGNFNVQPEVKSDLLIVKGPYKWIRNPMYLAVILFYFPIVFQNYNWINSIVFIMLIIVLILKILREEKFLKLKFGEDYLNYKIKTKRLIPFLF